MSGFIEENRYSDDGNVHDKQRLKELQALPLERKVLITQTRIIEWYKHYNGQVYVSFSGGKDSTVLLHIARQLFPDIEAVYVDTGLEYPELREFVKSIDNVTWLKSEMNFRQVLDKYGYPIISKDISRRVKDARSAIKKGNKHSYAFKMLNGTYTDKDGNLSTFNCEKWKFLIDAPFIISNYCCDIMKKKPLHKFDKQKLKKPITGIMADESSQRRA